MSVHPLKNRLSIDVDGSPATAWPNGLTKLCQIRVDGQRIGVLFFDPRERWLTSQYLDGAKRLGFLTGLRVVPHSWDSTQGQGTPEITPGDAARKYSDFIAAREFDGKRRVDVVEWDVETHDVAWQKEFLLGARQEQDSGSWTKGIRGRGGFLPDPARPETLGYRWGRPGIWTMEGRQDTSTSVAHLAAQTGLLVGPQCYDGSMVGTQWSCWYEIRTWCLNSNPEKAGANIPLTSFLPYTDADKRFRLTGDVEAVLFATSRLTELYV